MNNYIDLIFDETKINKNKIKSEWIKKNIPEYFKMVDLFEKTINIIPINYIVYINIYFF